jgi:OOP family OmpA-OmpF porin
MLKFRRDIQMNRKIFVKSLMALLLLAAVSGFAQDMKATVKGIIIARTGETLIVTTPTGEKTTVVLTDDTKTKDNRGLLGVRKQTLSNVVLIPGLKVKVDGTTDGQGRVVAKTISTDGDDLETAQMIEAGLHPTAEQVEANVQSIQTNKQDIATNKKATEQNASDISSTQQNVAANKQQIDANMKEIDEHTQRFNALAEYDTKGQATVNFAVGSAKLSAKGQQDLKALAGQAKGLTGYIVEVVGYTDSTGNAAMNTKLSEQRAQAVVTFLMQQGGVPVRHIIAPGAMGEYGSVATNETAKGRAENRRVDVKILVNKGISGA